MITIDTQAESVYTYSPNVVWHLRVESWLGGELLHDDIPVTAGQENVDRTARVPERVTLSVPYEHDGFTWAPDDDPAHPLAANGQRVRVSLGVEVTAGNVEWFQRGEYLILNAEPDDSATTVTVTATGLLSLPDEARLISPYQPSGTFKSTIRGLLEPGLSVTFDAALTDRSVPSGLNYDEDRLGAVLEMLDAWPARAYVTSTGYLSVIPVTVPTSQDFNLRDDYQVIRSAGLSSRDGVYNAVVARGVAADGADIQAVAYDNSGGPHAYGSSFSPYPVPLYFPSPLMTTAAQVQAAARTRLTRLLQETVTPITVQCKPLPFLQGGDAVTLSDGDQLYTIEAMALPLTAGGGAMKLVLVEVPGW